jgi:hypothetical protein
MKKFLAWSPRILTITFIIFISLFALDAFTEPNNFWLNLAGFFIHLIPSLILIIILLISWRQKLFGGITFIILSIIFSIFFHTYEDLIVFAILTVPMLIIGILYLIDHYKNKK